MWRIIVALVLALTSVGLSALPAMAAEPPETEWDKTFGGTGSETAWSVQQTSDGGYILAGWTSSFGTGNGDVWLVKTYPDGNQQWAKTFGGASSDYAHSVQLTADGGYIIAGLTYSFGAGNGDVWLVKTDSLGNKQWDKTFGGTGYDYGMSVQQTSDQGYIVVGIKSPFGSGDLDVWLIKTDSGGEKEWDKSFGGTSLENAHSVQLTADGGYIIAGLTNSFGAGGDAWLVKTDSAGNEQWQKTFGGTSFDGANSVQQTSDGGYIVAGTTQSFGVGNEDLWLIKTDSLGNKVWDKTFGGTSADYGQSVQPTSDGGYIVGGYTRSFGAGSADFWLVKTDAVGNKEWDKTFGGGSHDYGMSVQPTSDGGYIIAGETQSFGAGLSDFWLIKLAGENQPPAQPGNVSPANGATDIILTPILVSTSFFDPDTGDTHLASQWQITTGSYSSPVYDSGVDTIHKTLSTIPSGTLTFSTTYYWRVRHQDNHGAWSSYSLETSFSTVAQTEPPLTRSKSLPDPSTFTLVVSGLVTIFVWAGLSKRFDKIPPRC